MLFNNHYRYKINMDTVRFCIYDDWFKRQSHNIPFYIILPYDILSNHQHEHS